MDGIKKYLLEGRVDVARFRVNVMLINVMLLYPRPPALSPPIISMSPATLPAWGRGESYPQPALPTLTPPFQS